MHEYRKDQVFINKRSIKMKINLQSDLLRYISFHSKNCKSQNHHCSFSLGNSLPAISVCPRILCKSSTSKTLRILVVDSFLLLSPIDCDPEDAIPPPFCDNPLDLDLYHFVFIQL